MIEYLIQLHGDKKFSEVITYADNADCQGSDSQNVIGAAYMALGNIEKSEEHFFKSWSKDNNNTSALTNYLNVLNKTNRSSKAKSLALSAISAHRASQHLHNALGVSHLQLGEVAEATAKFKEAINLDPNFASPVENLAYVLMTNQDYSGAISILKAYTGSQRKSNFNNVLATCLIKSARYTEAKEILEKNLNQFPGDFATLNNLGNFSEIVGDNEGAIRYLDQAIVSNPNSSEAIFNRYKLQRKLPECELKRIIQLFEQNTINADDKARLTNVIAQEYDRFGIEKTAFEYFLLSNKYKLKSKPYSFETEEREFQLITQTFRQKPDKWLPTKELSQKPIFIVGLPRSGTTLLEQLLSNHPNIEGAGELLFSTKAVEHIKWDGKTLSNQQRSEFREFYRQSISSLNINSPNIVDKMPLNFKMIGFLLAAFPECRVIAMKRAAAANIFSIFKHLFSGTGNGYAYDLENIVKMHNLYNDYMAFWQARYPSKIKQVSYEEVVLNVEKEIREILTYLDLPFSKECTELQSSKKIIKTASSTQLRGKLNPVINEEDQRYSKFLAPYLEKLWDGRG